MEKLKYPKVSIVIPTLNAQSVLETCLEAIFNQDYPKDMVEILIPDGGSTDNTLNIAKKYGAVIVKNELKTAEAGKAVGVKYATGNFIALIDSDNYLPSSNWLKQMIIPLIEEDNKDVLGSEPWAYTWRKEDGFIDRYCALVGVNDPLVLFLGNYDRKNYITGTWTKVQRDEEDMGGYLKVTLDKRGIPTIGANGTVFRSDYLKKELGNDNYLFDIDILARTIHKKGKVSFIKTKNDIIHAYCGTNIGKFAKKQRRRIKDYLYHKHKAKDRNFDWNTKQNNFGLLKFFMSCVTVVPLMYQSLIGFLRKPDIAWLFHPLACEITLWEYGWGSIIGVFKKEEISRVGWKQ